MSVRGNIIYNTRFCCKLEHFTLISTFTTRNTVLRAKKEEIAMPGTNQVSFSRTVDVAPFDFKLES